MADVLCSRCPTVQDNVPLERAVDKMHASGCTALLVERNGKLVGMLTSEHLGDWVMLHSAMKVASSAIARGRMMHAITHPVYQPNMLTRRRRDEATDLSERESREHLLYGDVS